MIQKGMRLHVAFKSNLESKPQDDRIIKRREKKSLDRCGRWAGQAADKYGRIGRAMNDDEKKRMIHSIRRWHAHEHDADSGSGGGLRSLFIDLDDGLVNNLRDSDVGGVDDSRQIGFR